MKGNMTDQELREQAEVMLAYANAPEGKKPKLEFRMRGYPKDPWEPISDISWHPLFTYRIAPSPIAPGHNPDKLTVDQIPEGRRLMTVEEIRRGRNNCSEIWRLCGGASWGKSGWSGNSVTSTYCVPIDWKDPLAPKKLIRKPCGPEHFPPGTVVRGVNWPEHCCSDVVSRTQESIVILIGVNCSVSTMRYENMLPGHLDDHMIRSLDNGKTWLPCYVEVEE